jgi:hypothetical protein
VTASPEATYCYYLGSLVTKLDRVARIPKVVAESAAACVSKYERRARLKYLSVKSVRAILVLLLFLALSSCVLPRHRTPLAVLIKLFPTTKNQVKRLYTKIMATASPKILPLPRDVVSQLDTAPFISVRDFDASKPVDISSDAVGQFKIINASAHLGSLSRAVNSHEAGQSDPIYKALDSLLMSILPHIRRDQSSIVLQELVYYSMLSERGAYFPVIHWDGPWLQFPGVDGFQVWYLMEENDTEGGNMFMAHTNDLHKDDPPVNYFQSNDGSVIKAINDFDFDSSNDIPLKTFSDFNETGLELQYLDMHAGDCLIFSKRTLHMSDPRPFFAGLSPKRRALNVRVIIRDKGRDTIPVYPSYKGQFLIDSWLGYRALNQAGKSKQTVKNIVHVPISRFDMLDAFQSPW